MVSEEFLDRVVADLSEHVRNAKGYETESWINPLTPVDSISAFAMARLLTEQQLFDQYVSVAPEGHVYGYFFEKACGVSMLSVHVDYPPRRCEVLDDLGCIRDQRVLILEDDVASGTTLRLVLDVLAEFSPASVSLYLGRPKKCQVLDRIAPEISEVYVAEDRLDTSCRSEYESDFVEFFSRCFA